MNFLFSSLLFFLLPLAAWAYIPPAFFLYGHIAEQREKAPWPALQLSVSRPNGGGTEELLGTLSIPAATNQEGGWPALSILFSNEGDALVKSVQAFGLPVAKETDLLRAGKEQVANMKEPPRPFYKTDKSVALKRYRQTYAWVHKDSKKAIWIEKDTFLPLKIEGPCPEEVTDLSWAKSGDNLCELEFRNVYSLRRGSPQNSRLILWKDGAPVLFFSFDRVLPPKSSLATEAKVSAEIASIARTLLH